MTLFDGNTARSRSRRIFRSFCLIAIAILGVQLGIHRSGEVRSERSQNRSGSPELLSARLAETGGSADASNKSKNDWIAGKVVKVSDGDTVQVLEESEGKSVLHKIRLAGIDAPEKSQPFGSRARQALAELVAGKLVQVEVLSKDRYGRLVGRIWVGKEEVNSKMVSAGWAWYYRQFRKTLPEEMQDQLEEFETLAKEKKRGLWTDSQPTAPWEFRKEGKLAKKNAKQRRNVAEAE